MGIYYLAVNHTKREWLCGWCLGNGWKFGCWAHERNAGPLLCLLLDRWRCDSVELVADTGDRYFDIERTYRNVSPEAAARWARRAQRIGGTDGVEANPELCSSCRRRGPPERPLCIDCRKRPARADSTICDECVEFRGKQCDAQYRKRDTGAREASTN